MVRKSSEDFSSGKKYLRFFFRGLCRNRQSDLGLSSRFFQLFTTDVVVLDLLPAILPIMLGIMLVSPLYEITKYLLQSLERSRTVCVLTGCVNSLILMGIMVFWRSGQLNFSFSTVYTA